MSESKNEENKKTRENSEVDSDHTVKTSDNNKKKEEIKELSLEEKLKISEDK